ncbi:hypothetical protein M5D96_000730 [Drosophila gunungcola]|uniref:Uncharacterized protein n=1 Tax=Drosophila gunungcola TaxID=103775 RepID=A0A9P9YWT3_9MUSC|nr:hypothetical protein M5D96_000730 [Drosophila gunungcola]
MASTSEDDPSRRPCTGRIPTHLGHVRISLPDNSRPSYRWTTFSWMTRAFTAAASTFRTRPRVIIELT